MYLLRLGSQIETRFEGYLGTLKSEVPQIHCFMKDLFFEIIIITTVYSLLFALSIFIKAGFPYALSLGLDLL